MDSDYDGGTKYNSDNFAPSADVIYVLKPKAESDNPYYLNSEFFIIVSGYNSYTEEDIYEFNSID